MVGFETVCFPSHLLILKHLLFLFNKKETFLGLKAFVLLVIY